MHKDVQQNIPEHSVGGIVGRSAYHAWLPAAMMCESTWRLDPLHQAVIQGVAIDTEKFFDNVPPDKACEILLYTGLPIHVVATWHFMITGLKRYTSLNGAVSKHAFGASVGIPQGDPLSMLAAAARLGEWTREIPHDHIFAKVFVDDRLMLSTDSQRLQQAFHATQFWDGAFGFQTEAKTVAFGNNLASDNLWRCRSNKCLRQPFTSQFWTSVVFCLIKLPDHTSRMIMPPPLLRAKLYRQSATHAVLLALLSRRWIIYVQKSLKQQLFANVRLKQHMLFL